MIVYDLLEADSLEKLVELLNKNSKHPIKDKWKPFGTIMYTGGTYIKSNDFSVVMQIDKNVINLYPTLSKLIKE